MRSFIFTILLLSFAHQSWANHFISIVPGDTTKNKKKDEKNILPENFYPVRLSPALSPPDAGGIEYIKDESGVYANIDTISIVDTTSKDSREKYQKYKMSMHYLNKGMVQLNLKEYKKALKNFKKAAAIDKSNRDARLYLANAYTEVDQYHKSLNILNKEVEYAQKSNLDTQAVIYYNRAIVLTKVGKFDKAIQDFTKALQMKPNYTSAYMGRASARTVTKDYLGAVEDYSYILEGNKYQIQARRARAVCYSYMLQWDMAEYDLKMILEYLPEDGLSYYYLGLVYIKQNEMAKACMSFQKAKELKVEDADLAISTYCK